MTHSYMWTSLFIFLFLIIFNHGLGCCLCVLPHESSRLPRAWLGEDKWLSKVQDVIRRDYICYIRKSRPRVSAAGYVIHMEGTLTSCLGKRRQLEMKQHENTFGRFQNDNANVIANSLPDCIQNFFRFFMYIGMVQNKHYQQRNSYSLEATNTMLLDNNVYILSCLL